MRALFVVLAILWANPVWAQTEVTVSATGASSNVADVLTYQLYGATLEAARYVHNGTIGVTAEVGFALGTGEMPMFGRMAVCGDGSVQTELGLVQRGHKCRERREGESGLPTKINYSMQMALAGVRYRYPGARWTPSARVAGGITSLIGDERRQGLPVLTSKLFAMAVGGALDFRLSDEISLRAQLDVIHIRSFGGWAQYRAGWGGVFSW